MKFNTHILDGYLYLLTFLFTIISFKHGFSDLFYETLIFQTFPTALTGFLFGLFFEPEDRGDVFLRNVALSQNYMAPQLTRSFSS
jgi:hypothetical protein